MVRSYEMFAIWIIQQFSIPGNSDPYCVLGIFQLPDMDIQSATVSKNNLEDWHRERIVKNIVQSSTKPATQQPQWNERYEL